MSSFQIKSKSFIDNYVLYVPMCLYILNFQNNDCRRRRRKNYRLQLRPQFLPIRLLRGLNQPKNSACVASVYFSLIGKTKNIV